jgi:hypothetical protein
MTEVTGTHILAVAPAGSSAPESIMTSGGSIWVAYDNGAASNGASGSSTVVEYNAEGGVDASYTIAGMVSSLTYVPQTGNLWVSLNSDGNSSLAFISLATHHISAPLTYGSGYVYGSDSTRGFTSPVIDGSRVFMTETDPTMPGDTVVVQLLNGNAPFGTLQTQGILSVGDTGTNLLTGGSNQALPLEGPETLKLLPNGELLLSSPANDTYIFINDPGTAKQTETFFQLPSGDHGGAAVMPTETAGTFYIANDGGNDVVRATVTGLVTTDLYAVIPNLNELAQIDPSTGVVTPVLTGLSNPQGLSFVPSTPVKVSEPAAPVASVPSTPVAHDEHIFAVAPSGSSQPDSISVANGSIWVEYGNGASSTGSGGDSTIVQYSPSGSVESSYTVVGLADGLKVDPTTGNVWVLLNNDGNATLRFINPITHQISAPLTYGSGYVYGANSTRGFDDVAFDGSRVFMSETNPANPGDPVIVQVLNGNAPFGTIETRGILSLGDTGTNLVTGKTNQTIPITDPDSLKLLPNGDLLLTGEADSTYIFVKDPGMPQQSVSFVQMPKGFVGDDAIMPSASSGVFYISNQGGNDVVRVTMTGLNTSDLYADITSKNEFVQIDPNTGKITPILTGLSSPHGLDFVAAAASDPTAALASFVPTPGVSGLAPSGSPAPAAGLGTLAFADTTVGTGNLVGSIHNDVTASVHGAIALHHG